MFLTEPTLSGLDRRAVSDIRWELSVFRDVYEVLRSLQPDTVVVGHHGMARSETWSATLVDAGIGFTPPSAQVDSARPGEA